MSELDVAAVRARCEAATAGPWEPYFTVHGDPFVVSGRFLFPGDILATVSIAAEDYGRADALFIAHARTDVPALLDRLAVCEEGLANERCEREMLEAALADSVPRLALRVDQKLMIVQIPSEANAERLLNERLGDEIENGWRTVTMQDHNGFLVLLLERPAPIDGSEAS